MTTARESAELLRQVIPLMERPENWSRRRGGRRSVGGQGWEWEVDYATGILYVDFDVEEQSPFDSRSDASQWVNIFTDRKWRLATEAGGDLAPDEFRARAIAAVRLAVSRLYDGPQDAPVQPVTISSKPALCTERGCSQDRTVGLLCASHAGRAEVYAREAKKEKLDTAFAAVRAKAIAYLERRARAQEKAKPAATPVANCLSVEQINVELTVPTDGMLRLDRSLFNAHGGVAMGDSVTWTEGGVSVTGYVAMFDERDVWIRRSPWKHFSPVFVSHPEYAPAAMPPDVAEAVNEATCDRMPRATPKCRGHLDASAREHCQHRSGVAKLSGPST